MQARKTFLLRAFEECGAYYNRMIFVCLYFRKSFQPDIRNVQVARYVAPLREGGSLPAIVEADDGFLYVLKFRGSK